MTDFNLYFLLGVEHILTWEAMDHILFVAALCLRYDWFEWKKVVIMVTAFTIGHSVTLALAATGYINIPLKWVEFLIPLTIVATAANNLLQTKSSGHSRFPLIYFFALFFGMIHGMAYANTLLDLEGTDGLIGHLLAFNIGIELAQLLVVTIVLTVSFIFVHFLKTPRIWWLRILSAGIFVFAVHMAYQRFPI